MKRIFKYQLVIDSAIAIGHFIVHMPRGSKVLHVHTQGDSPMPYLWALVDDSEPIEPHGFAVYGTGHPCASQWQDYIGTAHCGPFVWHVFEVRQ